MSQSTVSPDRNAGVSAMYPNWFLPSVMFLLIAGPDRALNQTKERRPKRVPISRILIPDFVKASRVRRLFQDRVFLNAEGHSPHEDSLTRVWRTAVKAVGIDPRPTVHDLRHCWKTNAMRSGVHPAIADMIVGHGDKKKSLQSLYLTISDEDLLDAIDRMRFDGEEWENGGLFSNHG